MIQKYENDKIPSQNFKFYRLIWFPKNYKIETENNRKTLIKSVTYNNNNGYPFWRWSNFFLRTWVYFCNVFYIFGVFFKLKNIINSNNFCVYIKFNLSSLFHSYQKSVSGRCFQLGHIIQKKF